MSTKSAMKWQEDLNSLLLLLTLLPRGPCAILACFDAYRAFSKRAHCKADVKEQNSAWSHANASRMQQSYWEKIIDLEFQLQHLQLSNIRNDKALRKKILVE